MMTPLPPNMYGNTQNDPPNMKRKNKQIHQMMMMMKAQNMKRTMTKIAEKANCNQFWNQGGGVNEKKIFTIQNK